jgi:hypothetical protein
MPVVTYTTRFGSLDHFEQGRVEVIDDDPKHYAFSNVFAVASRSLPYEKVAVGKNLEYALEAIRAEGTSEWRVAGHDESALIMDGEVEIRLRTVDDSSLIPTGNGSVALPDDAGTAGQAMGHIVARRGHQALLPAGRAYQFSAERPSVILLQTMLGPDTVEKWADICQSEI